MRSSAALALALACAACSQADSPADDIEQAAETIVDPTPEPPPFAEGKWAPRDACGDVDGADAFRRQLAAAVAARDTDALVALAAEDVKLDFGDGAGDAELRARLSDPSRGLWAELDALMLLGCAANGQGGITIPWYFEQDLNEVDPGRAMLVTGVQVPVLDRGGPAGARIATISWDVVEIGSLDPASPYQRVEWGEDQAGYVATDKLRSLLDYRLTASSRNGRWRITSFVAGD